jgi:SsrA-binding protein
MTKSGRSPAPAKRSEDTLIAENRRARFDYEIGDTWECGVELKGSEVKSLREKKVSFEGAHARLENDALVLWNLKIDRWRNASTHEALAPTRARRLLVNKTEINKIRRLLQRGGLTLVPLKLYFKGAWVKVLIGIGKGKSHEDKRETIKRREADRDMVRAIQRR